MSIATIVTRGYGSFGSIAEVVIRGYVAGEAADEIVPEIAPTGIGAVRKRRKPPEDEYADRKAADEEHRREIVREAFKRAYGEDKEPAPQLIEQVLAVEAGRPAPSSKALAKVLAEMRFLAEDERDIEMLLLMAYSV